MFDQARNLPQGYGQYLKLKYFLDVDTVFKE